MIRRLVLLLPLAFASLPLLPAAAPPVPVPPGPLAPPPPAKYDITIRYRIDAFPNERIRLFRQMTGYLKAVGFVRSPDEEVPEDEPEDAKYTRMKGTIPAGSVPKLLRQRSVRSLLIVPKGKELPAKRERVRVDLLLFGPMAEERQERLHRQTAEVLKGLGFEEAVAYDHRGYRRLLGSIAVNQLGTLLEDLREAKSAKDAPAPFRTRSPILVTEARPDLALPRPYPKSLEIPPGQEKISPELRELLADKDRAERPTRMEVLLAYPPKARGHEWAVPLALGTLTVEGRIGPLVTVRGAPEPLAKKLAEMANVVAVRLPRAARVAAPSTAARTEDWEPLRPSEVARLHALRKRGKGTRVALVAADFRGWEALRGRKLEGRKLPGPVLVDLTRERNSSLQPDPYPVGEGKEGAGTRQARALLHAAPEAELTLVRIDPAAPYMLETVARSINGEPYRTIAIDERLSDVNKAREDLEDRKRELLLTRRKVLDDFRDDEKARKARLDYLREQKKFDEEEVPNFVRLSRRYLYHVADMKALRGIRLVASTLVWPDGYPVDGTSPLSRYFDNRPFGAALWFQAAGDTHGQAWVGRFRDDDHNGVMDFAGPERPLRGGAWTRELNYLAWQTPTGEQERDLPAETRLRVTLQWREAHDPAPVRAGEDPYRTPLAKLDLRLLYQPDPDGKAQPSDDLVVVAESAGLPQRLMQTLHAGTYEQVVHLTVRTKGRYAVQVLGRAPESTSPPDEFRIPSSLKKSDLWLRLHVETVGGDGRAVLSTYHTAAGSVGMPADARRVITVGAVDGLGRQRSSSARGSPYGMALRQKPEVLAYDSGEGTAAAASFAAGVAVRLHTSGPGLGTFKDATGERPRRLMRIPDDKEWKGQ